MSAASLLAWYDSSKRAMPWRESRDPYFILVSEFMLQQTRVASVLQPFERFVASFPSVQALAEASVDHVLAHWSGLGYYSRARRLHAAAQKIAAAGAFPETVAGLRDLPGVGEYTAAAVASIAFGVPEPVLDGNVVRVMTRLLATDADPSRAATRARLRSAAAQWLVPGRAGDSNQALMELGATVCTSRGPHCDSCPLRPECAAGRAGTAEQFPRPRSKSRQELHRRVAAAVEQDGRWLLVRHQDSSQPLGGIWEFPWVAAAAAALSDLLAQRYGGSWAIVSTHGVVKHAVTFRSLEVQVVRARMASGDGVSEGVEARWVAPAELPRVPHSSLVTKILRRLRAEATLGTSAAAGGEDVPADELVVDFPQALGDQRRENL